MKDIKVLISLIAHHILFWFKRKWSKLTAEKGEPSLDDFYRAAKKMRDF